MRDAKVAIVCFDVTGISIKFNYKCERPSIMS